MIKPLMFYVCTIFDISIYKFKYYEIVHISLISFDYYFLVYPCSYSTWLVTLNDSIIATSNLFKLHSFKAVKIIRLINYLMS